LKDKRSKIEKKNRGGSGTGDTIRRGEEFLKATCLSKIKNGKGSPALSGGKNKGRTERSEKGGGYLGLFYRGKKELRWRNKTYTNKNARCWGNEKSKRRNERPGGCREAESPSENIKKPEGGTNGTGEAY